MSIPAAGQQVLDFLGTPLVISSLSLPQASSPATPGCSPSASSISLVANYFRLYLRAAAMNLLVRLRRFIAEPLPVSVAGDCAGDQQGGASVVALLVGDHTQQVQCLQVPRLNRQDRLVESGCLVEAPVLMML
jgi:hypothetical protein